MIKKRQSHSPFGLDLVAVAPRPQLPTLTSHMKYSHPNRTSKNARGDFYTTGYWHDGEEGGDCLYCLLPEAEAPELLADVEYQDTYTHFVKQPTNEVELEHACGACEVCCVSALRYGGSDTTIISRLGNNPEYCDYILHEGKLVQSLDSSGEVLPFAEKYIRAYYRKLKIDYYLKFGFVNVWKYKVNKLLPWKN